MNGEILRDKFLEEYKIDRRINVFEIEAAESSGKLVLSGVIQNRSLKELFVNYCMTNTACSVNCEVNVLDETVIHKRVVFRVSVANLHKEPSYNSPVITQGTMGSVAVYIKRVRDWVMVQLDDKYIGWTNETVAEYSQEEFADYESAEKIIITALNDYVYDTEEMKNIVSDTVIGNIFRIVNTNRICYVVRYPDGRTGVINRKSAMLLTEWQKSRKNTAEAIVKTAGMFTGIPYYWGGISSKGLDCSGFTKLVYYLNGIVLPRDADQQAKCGTDVPLDKQFAGAKPGDLLFFGRKSENSVSDKIPITHVALSLGGKRYMQASGDIHVSSFDPKDPCFDKRRSESIQFARRII